jgi:hypothetical protein
MKLLNENICNGNTNIRDESSIHMRENFSSVNLLSLEIPREKTSLPTNTISQKYEDNLVIQSHQNCEQPCSPITIQIRKPNLINIPGDLLYTKTYCRPHVRPTDITCHPVQICTHP